MRKTAIAIQIVGILVCALGGIGASVVFSHAIESWRDSPDPSMHTMGHFVNFGLELAGVTLVVVSAGTYLLIYGSRMLRREKAKSKGEA